MHTFKKLFPQNIKNLYHLVQAVLANVMYGFPSKKIKVIGITGTDGKTTTCQMIAEILEEAGKKVALASTINFRINGSEEKNLSHYTTESSFSVQKFIKKAVEEGCKYLVLETSSHSLDQHRVWGVEYQTAVITNVTREHLDYHGTMEKYRDAKKKLFEIVAKNKGTIIVNLDMEKPEEFLNFEKVKKYVYTCHRELVSESGFRIKSGMTKDNFKIIQAENIELGIDSSKFEILNSKFILNIPGQFNVENALAAICVGQAEKIDFETMKKALQKITGVSGRMETVANDRGLDILVDYAVTPNALKKLYAFLSSVKKEGSKVIAVFGSCGDRDKGKRPIMAQTISKFADFMIITNEEPYREDPKKIIDEISAGIKNKKEGGEFWKIIDRREAIRKAFEIAKAGDIIAITGMGAQESMVVGDKKIPWNDRNVIEEELQKLP